MGAGASASRNVLVQQKLMMKNAKGGRAQVSLILSTNVVPLAPSESHDECAGGAEGPRQQERTRKRHSRKQQIQKTRLTLHTVMEIDEDEDEVDVEL